MGQAIRLTANHASTDTLAYLAELTSIDDLKTLQESLVGVTRAIGFDVYVLGQLPRIGHERTDFKITSYPQAWIDEAYPRFRYKADPVLDALLDADTPFLWEDLPAYSNPTPAQADYIAISTEYGFLRGYAVPIRTPGEPIGVVSYATKDNGPVPRPMLPFAQQIAVASFKKAHSIVAQERGRMRAGFDLTDYEIVCLRSAAQGKSEFIIARLTQTEIADVRRALRSVQAKFGVRNRVSMVVKALQFGFLTFNQALIE
ncbi:MAG: autoinducer binding domain-containing protein [Janthinobacterium lividum]